MNDVYTAATTSTAESCTWGSQIEVAVAGYTAPGAGKTVEEDLTITINVINGKDKDAKTETITVAVHAIISSSVQ